MSHVVARVPKYSLHKPSGQAKVKYKGRVYYLGKHGTPKSKEAYARFISQLSQGREPERSRPVPVATPLLIGELVLQFWEHCKSYYVKDGKRTGEDVTVHAALQPLVDSFGMTPAAEFGPKKLKLVREEMIRLKWSRRYINAQTSRIRRMFTWAASEELIPGSVALDLRTVQGLLKNRSAAREKPEVGPARDADVEAILPKLSPIMADMVRVQRLCGCRPGELLAMTVEAIDRSDPSCWEYRPATHKERAPRQGTSGLCRRAVPGDPNPLDREGRIGADLPSHQERISVRNFESVRSERNPGLVT